MEKRSDKEVRQVEVETWGFELFKEFGAIDEKHFVVLILLILYRDGYLKQDDFADGVDSKIVIIDLLKTGDFWAETGDGEYSTDYRSVRDLFLSYTGNLYHDFLNRLLEQIFRIDREALEDSFEYVFDYLLQGLSKAIGYSIVHLTQPIEITRLIMGLADLKEGASVYNPFAGLASYGLNLSDGQHYYGEEINRLSWAIGVLRLMAYKQDKLSVYRCTDSTVGFDDKNSRFDLVVSTPPFNYDLRTSSSEISSHYSNAEHLLLGEGINMVKEDGKVIGLVAPAMLSGHRRGVKEMWQNMLELDYLDTVIALPSGLLEYAGISTAVVVLNKNKQYPGKVRFVKADEFVESHKNKKVLLDVELLEYFNSKESDGEHIRFVNKDEIEENDFNLMVSRYFNIEVEGIRLGSVIKDYRGDRVTGETMGRLVRIRDLSDSSTQAVLDVDAIDVSKIKRNSRMIDRSCLLLAAQGRNAKPTYFKYDGDPIYISNNIYAYLWDEEVVTPNYLVHELTTEYVEKQLEAYRAGDFVPRISRKDLHRVIINLPGIDEQYMTMQGMEKLLYRMASLEEIIQSRDTRLQQVVAEEYTEYASLKHTLGTPRQNIASSIYGLIYFFSKKPEGYEALNKQFEDMFDLDILSALMGIEKSINQITNILEKGERGLVLSNYDKEIVPLSQVSGWLKNISDSGYNFKIELQDNQIKDIQHGVEINLVLLQVLVDNILMNANVHAFDKESESNRVVIELYKEADYLNLSIKNNGKPFPEKYDKEKYIGKFNTTNPNVGSGLGGYDVNRIASYFDNDDWGLLLGNPIYPVEFNFKFQIKPI